MSENIRIKVEVPDWNTYNSATKSLISFFLENASLFCRGEYEGDELTYMSSALLMDCLKSCCTNFEYGLSEDIAQIGATWGEDISEYWYGQYSLCKDGIPYVNTEFFTTSSAIKGFYTVPSGDYYTGYDPVYIYTSDKIVNSWDYFNGDTFVNPGLEFTNLYVPIDFVVTKNDVEINDPSLVPSFLFNKEEDEQGYHVVKFPIDSSRYNLSYTFQFRTSSFTIKYTDENDDAVEKDVFYKMGLWTNKKRYYLDYEWDPKPGMEYFNVDSDGYYSLSEVLNFILNPTNNFKFSLYKEDYSSEYFSSGYMIFYHIDGNNSDLVLSSDHCRSDFIGNVLVTTPSKDNTTIFNQVTKANIFPLYHYATPTGTEEKQFYLLGYIYLKLYNQDGTPFTDSIPEGTDIGVKETDNSQADYNILASMLSLTNQYMNGGFVPSSSIKEPPIVTLGNYPQSSSEPEPLEWYVLDTDTVNNRSLLISKHIIDGHVYHDVESDNVYDPTWETCSLRAWLNNEFLNTAFTESERSRINLTRVVTPDTSDHYFEEDTVTNDYVFLLSVEEVASYFPNKRVIISDITQYAQNNNVSSNKWWLRSPNSVSTKQRYYDGGWHYVHVLYPYCVVYDSVSNETWSNTVEFTDGIRPVIWVDNVGE